MKKTVLITIAVIILLWVMIGLIDYYRVNSFQMPVFCIGTDLADDGGSGHYVGLGYSFDIDGNFMPEDEFPGITKWTYCLFGVKIQTKTKY